MNDVLKYVEENAFDHNISQISVADKFGISVYSLSRLFSKDIGIGFSEFIISKRIEKAKKILETTDKSVTETANESGMVNVNYFSRLFKEVTGETPQKYRASKKAGG